MDILPGTGRWQRNALTEGVLHPEATPSTMLRMVHLPVPGRIIFISRSGGRWESGA